MYFTYDRVIVFSYLLGIQFAITHDTVCIPYRYEKDGEALLVLIPSEEEGMVEQLKTKKIPVSKIKYVGYLILNTMEMNLVIMFSCNKSQSSR